MILGSPRVVLESERLLLRFWGEGDRDLFREINADPKVMEFFPFRRAHAQSDALLDTLNESIRDTGLGFYAMELKQTGEPLGFCGLSHPNMPEIFPQETVEMGWRLATRYWGNGYATEAAAALLDFAFNVKSIDAVVAFAVAANRRSTAVMERIGMRPWPQMDFDHPRVPDTHPHLKRHLVYAAVSSRARNG